MSQAAAVKWSAAGAAAKLRCIAGLHAWPTWGVPRLVDVEWTSPTLVRKRGWETAQQDTSLGIVQFHQAQGRACLSCGRRKLRYFWHDPGLKSRSLEFGGGGYAFVTYRDAVACGLFAGPPPAGVDHARLDDVVLPMFRDDDWPPPAPVLLACRLGLYHFRRFNPEPRFRYEQICPFCNMVFWM